MWSMYQNPQREGNSNSHLLWFYNLQSLTGLWNYCCFHGYHVACAAYSCLEHQLQHHILVFTNLKCFKKKEKRKNKSFVWLNAVLKLAHLNVLLLLCLSVHYKWIYLCLSRLYDVRLWQREFPWRFSTAAPNTNTTHINTLTCALPVSAA